MDLDHLQDDIFEGAYFDRCPRQMARKLAPYQTKPEDVDEEEKSVVAKVTTESVDRDREVVITSGLDTSSIDPKEEGSNPVVLYMHDPFTVIGKVMWIKRAKRHIVAKTRFAPTDFAQEVFKLYAGGFMKGWSIGMDYATIKRRKPEPNEIKRNPAWAKAEFVVESAEVYEYSAVSIPANRDALTKAWKGGLIKHTEPLFDRFLRSIDTDSKVEIVSDIGTDDVQSVIEI